MEELATISVDNVYSTFQLSDGSLVNCEVIDTAGQERYKSIVNSYYRNADCCLLVYDVTNRKSFEECKNYYNKKLKEYSDKIIKIILLGNKTDLEDKRVIFPEEGANFAEENNYIFMETSCKDNYNVADAFTALVEMANTECKRKGIDISAKKSARIKLKKVKTKTEKKCCLFSDHKLLNNKNDK